ncbi:MAG: TetR/AcrR family transcriptional regulator [Propionibacteriaceae bacterium]|nr:TetR/AcrR family transcriptional regulator [Propionibacteriaceae bacterium]
MPRITEAARQHRRDDIAAAARRCFLRDGYAATSMASIIAEAGSSAGAVYCHFESKAELLRFVATDLLQDRLGALRQGLRSVSGDRDPARVADLLMSSAPDAADAGLLLQMWAQAPTDPAVAEVAGSTVRALRKFVRKALLPWAEERFEDPLAVSGQVADVVLAAVHGYLVRRVLSPEADPHELRRQIVAGLAAAGR